MKRMYRVLLRLYPYDFRAAFEREMLVGELLAGARFESRREVAGLLRGAVAEWCAKLTTDPSVRGRALPDLRMMRPAGVSQAVWFGATRCTSDTSR
jgi:hypothetical protein